MNHARRATPTIPVTAPLAEAWPAPADFCAFGARLLEHAKAQMAVQPADGITGVSLAVGPAGTVGVLASPRARPHVDPSYPPWSALWVLQACGHRRPRSDTHFASERSISRPSQRACAQSQTACVGHTAQSQPICVGNCPRLRVGTVMFARRYKYRGHHRDKSWSLPVADL
jgi:hypothetical protein